MVARALIQHKTVSQYLRYVATTIGRDKLLRTIQYFSRFYAWYLYRTNNPSSAIQPWNTIKTQLGLTRKIMRVGKFVEHLRLASDLYEQKTINSDKVAQYLQILRQFGYAGYLFNDMLTVLDAMGVKKYAAAKRYQQTAYKFWLSGLVASALAGIYANYRLTQRDSIINEKDAEGKLEKTKIAKLRSVANTQLLSDICDITVPASALGYVNLDDGIVGLAGTLSSIIGARGVWAKSG